MAKIIATQETATPSTPGATIWKLYFKAGGLYIISSSGVELKITDETETNSILAAITAIEGDVATLQDDVAILNPAVESGWREPLGTWAYSSLDSPTGVLTVNADIATLVNPGTRIRFTQTQALTAYWNMDSNSNSQVGSHNGTDTAMTYTAGKFSNAATFNGTTSKIVITDHANLKPTGEFTVGLWAKTNVSGSLKVLCQSFSLNTNYAGIMIRIGTGNVVDVFVGKNTGTVAGTDYTQVSGVTNVCDNNNHYIVVTFRNNYIQLYIDGVLEAASYCVSPAYAATNYVRVGCRNITGTDDQFLNGQIDDVFFINGYALDEETIRAKYVANTAQGTDSLTLTKYALVHKMGNYSGGNTLVYGYFGTDFTLANSTVTDLVISGWKAPTGLPLNPRKWTYLKQDITDRTQASPTTNVWYNLGGVSVDVPLGLWRASYSGSLNGLIAAAGTIQLRTTLSTGNNTESDPGFTMGSAFLNSTGATLVHKVRKLLALQSKTTYYFNSQGQVSTYTSITNYNAANTPLVLEFESAYL